MSLDQIALRGLRVFARHGVAGHERREGQEFGVDAVLWLDTGPAAAGDDLGLTVDYGALARKLVEVTSGPPVNLLETLAHRLVSACLAERGVVEAEITVHKPDAPIPYRFGDVSVTVRRKRP